MLRPHPTCTLLLGALAVTFAFSAKHWNAYAAATDCPTAGETQKDCPWAGIGRRWDALQSSEKNSQGLKKLLAAHAPELVATLETDRSLKKNWAPLWGQSINFDELAQGQIVAPELMDALAETTGTLKRDGLRVHAGLEHVTGYLFSTLVTPYGFKRARWVDGDIEKGLGLPPGIFLPGKRKDSPLVNLSVLLGSIALSDDEKARATVVELTPKAHPAIRSRLKGTITGQRIEEDTTIEKDGKSFAVQLRTDFIPFSVKSEGGNTALLIYSLRDARDGRSRLITAFPIKDDFMIRGLDPAGLGADKEIKLRYNAWLEGWGEPKSTTRKGSRAVKHWSFEGSPPASKSAGKNGKGA